jgi:hypothetical protein
VVGGTGEGPVAPVESGDAVSDGVPLSDSVLIALIHSLVRTCGGHSPAAVVSGGLMGSFGIPAAVVNSYGRSGRKFTHLAEAAKATIRP